MDFVRDILVKDNVDPRVLSLVANGVVTLHLTVSKDGYELLCAPNQPHPKLGVYPHQKYKGDQIVRVLAKTLPQSERANLPGSSKNPAEIGVSPLPGGLPPVRRGPMNYYDAAKLVQRYSTYVNSATGVQEILSPSHMTNKHFEACDYNLEVCQAWATYVAAKKTPTKAVAQIRSSRDLRIPGCDDLVSWWQESGPSSRFALLGKGTHAPDAKRDLVLSRLDCPFQGTPLEIPLVEDWEDFSSGGVEIEQS